MLHCSLNIPHPAFQTNATWLAAVNASAVGAPPWADAAAMHPADRYAARAKNVSRDFTVDEIVKARRRGASCATVGDEAEALSSPQKVRTTYYAMAAEADYLVGRVLDAARATRAWAHTYVVFCSDHGEMNMEHRQVRGGRESSARARGCRG